MIITTYTCLFFQNIQTHNKNSFDIYLRAIPKGKYTLFIKFKWCKSTCLITITK